MCRLLGVSVFLVLVGQFPAHAVEAPFQSLELIPGVRATFDSFGNLALIETANGRRILSLGDGIQDPVFAAGAAEGAEHGLRGFSRGADDDGDGLVDEDRLDGRDNDGDGLIDEDFAAIGDAMAVWDAPDKDKALHREYYHWSYDLLKPALFFSFSAASRTREPTTLILQANFPWNAVELKADHRTQSGRTRILHTRARVTAVKAAAGEGSDIWLGFKLLGSASTAAQAPELMEQTLGRMALEPGPRPVSGVVVAARSWEQLSVLLCEAEQVYQGLKDPVTGKQVRWIVPPSCSLPRRETAPACVWQPDGVGGGNLVVGEEGGIGLIPDPDILLLDGRLLASPDEIQWSRENQPRPWFRYRFSDLLRNRPAPTPLWESLDARENQDPAGPLILKYEQTPEPLRSMVESGKTSSAPVLEGRRLDGGRWQAVLEIAPAPRPVENATEKSAAGTNEQRDHLVLSPALLLGWPNPFRDRVQIRCRVPGTAQEAFAPGDDDGLYEQQDKTWPALPWGEGEPMVSVRIYSLSGQEIKALYSGRQGSGEFVVQWDGTDTFGRPVASGPYLCKLQLDGLSLTRRLVYLR